MAVGGAQLAGAGEVAIGLTFDTTCFETKASGKPVEIVYGRITPNVTEGGGLVARQRQITLGPTIGSEYIVQAGLKQGDKLITGGIQKIADGAPVQPMPAGPPGDGRGGRSEGK